MEAQCRVPCRVHNTAREGQHSKMHGTTPRGSRGLDVPCVRHFVPDKLGHFVHCVLVSRHGTFLVRQYTAHGTEWANTEHKAFINRLFFSNSRARSRAKTARRSASRLESASRKIPECARVPSSAIVRPSVDSPRESLMYHTSVLPFRSFQCCVQ